MLPFLLLMADPAERSRVMQLFDRFHDDMLCMAKEALYARGDANFELNAEDVVQGAFMKLARYIYALRPDADEQTLKAYVMTVLRHEISDFLSDCPGGEADIPVENIEDDDFFERVRITERYEQVVEAIKSLDEKYALTLLMHYRDEVSVKKIARMMGVSEKTVYTRLARGKKLVLKALEKEGY